MIRSNIWIPDSLTSSLVPVKPFNSPPSHIPTIEVEEFIPEKGDAVSPFMSYVNHLYVYPHLLKYDSQKHFTKVKYKPDIFQKTKYQLEIFQ